jgi:predicted phosphodiesterase
MRTLIISDIHGNLPALEAIIEWEMAFDKCLFLGDVVDYGPFPKECIHFLMNEMDCGVIGNHDNAIANNDDCRCRGDFRQFSLETRAWHSTFINDKEKKFLQSLQPIQKIYEDGKSVLLAHATPQGDLFHYLSESKVQNSIDNIEEEIIFLGHTHIQFQR